MCTKRLVPTPAGSYDKKSNPEMCFSVTLAQLQSEVFSAIVLDDNSISSDTVIGSGQSKLRGVLVPVPGKEVNEVVSGDIVFDVVDSAGGKCTGTVTVTLERETTNCPDKQPASTVQGQGGSSSIR